MVSGLLIWENQYQQQLPSDLLAGLCITHSVTSPGAGPLLARSSTVWSGNWARNETRCLLGEGAGWRPADWRMMQPRPNKYTGSAWVPEEMWMLHDQEQRERPDGPLGEMCLVVGTWTLGKDHGYAKSNSWGMRGSLGWYVSGSSHICLCFPLNAKLWLQ